MITYEKSKTNEKNQNSDPNPVVTTKMMVFLCQTLGWESKQT